MTCSICTEVTVYPLHHWEENCVLCQMDMHPMEVRADHTYLNSHGVISAWEFMPWKSDAVQALFSETLFSENLHPLYLLDNHYSGSLILLWDWMGEQTPNFSASPKWTRHAFHSNHSCMNSAALSVWMYIYISLA